MVYFSVSWLTTPLPSYTFCKHFHTPSSPSPYVLMGGPLLFDIFSFFQLTCYSDLFFRTIFTHQYLEVWNSIVLVEFRDQCMIISFTVWFHTYSWSSCSVKIAWGNIALQNSGPNWKNDQMKNRLITCREIFKLIPIRQRNSRWVILLNSEKKNFLFRKWSLL